MSAQAESHLALPYPWQQSEWQRVLQLQAQQKLPHALMLGGQKGLGKAHFAAAVAHYLLCLAPQSGLACENCRNCRLNQAQTHPDIHWVSPEETGKAIKVDQIRHLAEFVSKTSQQGGLKVAVIAPAEAMNVNAANALLKSLEEPSGDTLLLLVSHAPSAVLATIRSRCQQLNFAVPDRQQTLPWLKKLVGNADADALLDFAGNAPLVALALLEGDALEQRSTMLNDLQALAEGRDSALGVARRWMAFEPITVVEWVLIWLYSGARVWVTGAANVELGAVFQHLHIPLVYRYIDKVMQLKRQLLSRANPNKQLLLEELLMDWSALTRHPSSEGSRQSMRNGLS